MVGAVHLPLDQDTCAGAPLCSLAGTVNLEGRIVLLRPAKKVAHVSPPLKALPVAALTLTQVTGVRWKQGVVLEDTVSSLLRLREGTGDSRSSW